MEGVPIKILGRATLTSSPFFEKKKTTTTLLLINGVDNQSLFQLINKDQ